MLETGTISEHKPTTPIRRNRGTPGTPSIIKSQPTHIELDTALNTADWRRTVRSTVGTEEANDLGRRQLQRALAWVSEIDELLPRQAALLALPNITAYARAIVSAALMIERIETSHEQVLCAHPALVYLRDGKEVPDVLDRPVLPPAEIRYAPIKRLARLQSWTGWAKLPRAVAAPDAVAITHNGLLRDTAQTGTASVGFSHAEVLLAKARKAAGSIRIAPADGYANGLANVLVGTALGAGPHADRAVNLIRHVAVVHLTRALSDMAGLREVLLPTHIWSGSGGPLASRAIGLEVLRRGGTAIRFDHGTPRGFVHAPEATHMLELAVSSECCLATAAAAQICTAEAEDLKPSRLRAGKPRGLTGDPTFDVPRRAPNQTRNTGNARVVYAPTQLLGFRQLLPAQPNDLVYLDWQLRVAEALQSFAGDLVCQPHPEGFFAGIDHPLEQVAPTVRGNFNAQFGTADVFVFDYPSTTALWQAACTDTRIVYLDLGAGRMSTPIRELFARRAIILDVEHDADNRPILEIEALRDAVLAGRATDDPEPFRGLLAGDRHAA